MEKARLAVTASLVALALGGLDPALPVHAAAVPGTTCNVFPADNIWNTDISHLPVNANSATWMASTLPVSGRLHPDFGGPPYGIPFNVVDNTHATTLFNFQYAGESDSGSYPYGNDLLIEQGSDAHLLSINKDTCKLYETFATNYNGPSTAGSGAIFDLGSNQLRQASWTSADAAGLPIFPGLVRWDEVQAGFIGHAIRFTVHNTNDTYLWPARHHAGTSDPSLPPMGARFRLKSTYDISAFGPEARVVLTAFQLYGLIVADNGSDWYFQGSEDARWNDPAYQTMISDLKKIPAGQFEAVDESALMIDPNSAQAGTVPAAPTGPSATPRDSGAQVSWTAPANGGQPILGYTVNGSPSGRAIVGAGATTAVVYGLTNGISYTFAVTASNVIGTGAPSATSNSIVPNDRLTAQSSPVAATVRAPVSQANPTPPGPRIVQTVPRTADPPSTASAPDGPAMAPPTPVRLPLFADLARPIVLRLR